MPLVSVPTGQQLITESLEKKGGKKKKNDDILATSTIMPPPAPTPKRKGAKKEVVEYTSIVLADSDKPAKELKKPRGRKSASASATNL